MTRLSRWLALARLARENRCCTISSLGIVHRPTTLPHAASRQVAVRVPSGIRRVSTSHATGHAEGSQQDPSGKAALIIYSANQPAELADRTLKLLSVWQLSASHKGLTRKFTFTSFSAAWRFMTAIAAECKVKKHHPSWSNLYNEVDIEWTTHKPEGLSIKDVEMAEFCDRMADEIGLK